MKIIEHLKREEEFLSAALVLENAECEEVENATDGGNDFPNFRLKTALRLLASETLCHCSSVRHLIEAYERIKELEEENTRLQEQVAMTGREE